MGTPITWGGLYAVHNGVKDYCAMHNELSHGFGAPLLTRRMSVLGSEADAESRTAPCWQELFRGIIFLYPAPILPHSRR